MVDRKLICIFLRFMAYFEYFVYVFVELLPEYLPHPHSHMVARNLIASWSNTTENANIVKLRGMARLKQVIIVT